MSSSGEMRLAGRGAIVTGGGRGIGAAVARALAAEGAAVVVAARTSEQLEAVAAEIRDSGQRAWPQVCDVTDPDSVEELASRAREHLQHIDILVNNAGIATSDPLHRITLEQWNRVMAVNATGTFLCTQAFVPAMLERGWGRVVNIASVASRTGASYIAAYAASKHAVLGFTRCIAAEVAGAGLTVNAVCPGYVDTEMTHAAIDRITGKTGISRQQAMASILEASPQRRLIEPEEVAGATLWLCQDEARGINGQAILIDGGAVLA